MGIKKQNKSNGKWIGTMALVVGVVIAMRVFVGEVCMVASESMSPAIQPTEIIVYNKLIYGCHLPRRWADIPILNVFTWVAPLRNADKQIDWGFHRTEGIRVPQVGDVAVFQSPENPNVLLVKRIHRIIKKGSVLKIDSIQEKDVLKIAEREGARVVYRRDKLYIGGKQAKTYTTKETFYDMRGDNQNNSYDSRFFGCIPEHAIVGNMGFILFSWDENASFLHKIRWNRIFRIIQ